MKVDSRDTDAPMHESSVARTLAAEDVRRGDFVSVLSETIEVPSFLWCSDVDLFTRDTPVRIPFRSPLGGVPLKVKSICLPFLFVCDPAGEHHVLDLRACQLVRLAPDYARYVRKRLRRSGAKARGSRRTLR